MWLRFPDPLPFPPPPHITATAPAADHQDEHLRRRVDLGRHGPPRSALHGAAVPCVPQHEGAGAGAQDVPQEPAPERGEGRRAVQLQPEQHGHRTPAGGAEGGLLQGFEVLGVRVSTLKGLEMPCVPHAVITFVMNLEVGAEGFCGVRAWAVHTRVWTFPGAVIKRLQEAPTGRLGGQGLKVLALDACKAVAEVSIYFRHLSSISQPCWTQKGSAIALHPKPIALQAAKLVEVTYSSAVAKL